MPGEKSIQAPTVSSVLCSSHVGMALDCFSSVEKFASGGAAIRFRIHDDGSLSDADCDRLATGLCGDVEIVRRAVADEVMRERLREYPALFSLRDGYPPALKMLDAPLWEGTATGGEAQADRFVCIDGDILFLRRIAEPFAIPEDADALFMADRESNYSLRSWQLLVSRKLRLPARVNVGIIAMRRAAYDLDFLNWFVSRKAHHGIPWVVEQTAWAALGYRAPKGCRVLDPGRVRVMREHEDYSDLAIGHFTGRTRHLLPEFVERSRQIDADHTKALSLAAVHVEACRAIDLLRYEARRVRERLMPRSIAVASPGAVVPQVAATKSS